MVLYQLKNTVKYVNITRCNKQLCHCFKEFINKKPLINKRDYNEYVECYKNNSGETKDMFLL